MCVLVFVCWDKETKLPLATHTSISIVLCLPRQSLAQYFRRLLSTIQCYLYRCDQRTRRSVLSERKIAPCCHQPLAKWVIQVQVAHRTYHNNAMQCHELPHLTFFRTLSIFAFDANSSLFRIFDCVYRRNSRKMHTITAKSSSRHPKNTTQITLILIKFAGFSCESCSTKISSVCTHWCATTSFPQNSAESLFVRIVIVWSEWERLFEITNWKMSLENVCINLAHRKHFTSKWSQFTIRSRVFSDFFAFLSLFFSLAFCVCVSSLPPYPSASPDSTVCIPLRIAVLNSKRISMRFKMKC